MHVFDPMFDHFVAQRRVMTGEEHRNQIGKRRALKLRALPMQQRADSAVGP